MTETELNQIRDMNVKSLSRESYERSSAHFILWLNEHKPHLINPAFRQAAPNSILTSSFIRASLNQHSLDLLPINFESLEARDFLEWVIRLRKSNGDKPSYASLNGHKSALKNLFIEKLYRPNLTLSFQPTARD